MRRICTLLAASAALAFAASCTTTVGFFCDRAQSCEGLAVEQCETQQKAMLDNTTDECRGLLDSVIYCWSTNSTCSGKHLGLIDGKCTKELDAARNAKCPEVQTVRGQ